MNQNSFEEQLKPGVLLMEEGHFSEALRSFEALTKSHPQEAAAYYFQGLALGNLERHEEAAQAFKEALDLSPASLPILFNFAVSCLHTERWQAALLTLTRYVKYHPRGNEYRAYLLLGVAAAESCGIGEPLTFPHFLAYEHEQLNGEKLSLDLREPLPAALLTLCFAILGSEDEQNQMLSTLREKDSQLATTVESALPDIQKWVALNPTRPPDEGQTKDTEHEVANPPAKVDSPPQRFSQQSPGADFKWESNNEFLREQLSQWSQQSADETQQTQPAEAPDVLLRALGDAYLLVPTEGEIENDGDTPVFSIMLRPHQAFNNDLVGIAFTGVFEAKAFFGGEHVLHRVVMPGEALATMVGELNTTLGESSQIITAIIVDPAGPHPYIFHWPDLLKIAADFPGLS